MSRNSLLLLALFAVLFALPSCGGEEKQEEDKAEITIETKDENGDNVKVEINTNELEDAMNKVAEALNNTDGQDVEVMNFRDIKEAIPDRLIGIDRTNIKGETTGAMGFKISQAEAEFEEDDKYMHVSIVDASAMGMARMGAAAWMNLEVDKENDDGYERTTTIDGNKAYEKWTSRTEKGELHMFYNDRYIVSIEARGIDMDDLQRALSRLDLDELE